MKKINNIIKTFLMAMLMVSGIASKAQDQPVVQTTIIEKTVAILPITYVGDGNQSKMDEMRYRLQRVVYLYLKDKATALKFQDPAETNALLLKKGIRDSNARQFTPQEFAAILGVGYVLTGMVVQETVGSSSSNNSNWKNFDGGKQRQGSSHSRSTQEMNTNIDLSIYNDKGEAVFSKSRHSILSDVDAYMNGLTWLLKRTPIYKK